ncbi:hypothetical protein [Sphingomonas parapaucimobilis]|uniref:Uncharacterized protein n=1 Tax=Sphingomonas parapaucimobilis NBRC 15100 TaxID=1219049 RepID=A0A0A1W6H7_9SPHN|nr:hypothetical protein [Sphingomonas parapaucimobilis]GAM00736.1 hypothetical protein SP5_035_01380 [Sphingomonas parapaucimobilis NBRC 15100]
MAGNTGDAARIGGTAVAMVLVPIVLAVVAMVVGLVAGLFYMVMTVIRPEIIGFFVACLAGGVGVAAARAACDAVLRGYAPRIVFVELLGLCLAGLFYELVIMPMAWARLAPIAQLLVVGATAYSMFWQSERVLPAR